MILIHKQNDVHTNKFRTPTRIDPDDCSRSNTYTHTNHIQSQSTLISTYKINAQLKLSSYNTIYILIHTNAIYTLIRILNVHTDTLAKVSLLQNAATKGKS